MRLSVCENDPGYNDWGRLHREGRKIQVFLDELDVTERCRTADTEKGDVLAMRLDERGDPFVDPATNEVAEETLHGVVRILIDGEPVH